MKSVRPSCPVRCATCGFLAARAKRVGRWRPHSGYFELELKDRADPSAEFELVPGETNAVQKGELGCFRGAVDLPREIADLSTAAGPDAAAKEVLQRDRSCASWAKYRPGLDPVRLHEELRREALEEDRKEFHRKLSEWEQSQNNREQRQGRQIAKAAIWAAIILGLAQILASILTSDAIRSQVIQWLLETLGQGRGAI